jgi:hypothetical protein
VRDAGAQVPVKRYGGLVTERAGARAPTFAQDDDDILIEVNIGDGEMRELGAPHPRVEKQPHDCHVAAVGEVLTLAGF